MMARKPKKKQKQGRARRTANTVTGAVHGVAVQAGKISGGVHVHAAARGGRSMPHRVGLVPPRAGWFQDRPTVALEVSSPPGGAAARTIVLSGLGGVGKTQLAVEYAENLWAAGDLDLLVWIPAQSRSAIMTMYARTIQDLLGEERTDVRLDAERFIEWLATTGKRWLIVFDDLVTPADLQDLWPPVTSSGRVVATTRRQDAALRGHGRALVKVEEFTSAESVAYLSSNFGDRSALLDGAEELAEALGNLPLALSQAAAYMVDRRLSCRGYLERLRERTTSLTSLLPEPEALPDGYTTAAAATWSLSVELANSLTPAGLAEPVLVFASLLDPSGIPVDIFRDECVTRFLNGETGRTIGPDDAVDALGCLQRLSLVSFASAAPTSPDRQVVRIHALVQRATRETLSKGRLRFATMAASATLLQAWDDCTHDQFRQQLFRSNTRALQLNGDSWIWNASALLARVGESLCASSLLGEAVDYLESLHRTYVERLGHLDDNTLYVHLQLARCRGYSRDIDGAITEFRSLVDHCHQAFAPDDTRTLAARNSLARWEAMAGPSAESVKKLTEILSDGVRIMGAESPDTADIHQGLALVRHLSGDAPGALLEAEESLTRHLQIFGPADERTLLARTRRAEYLGKTGKTLLALSEMQELLTEYVQVFGNDHLDTLRLRVDIGQLMGESGQLDNAVDSIQAVVDKSTELFGAHSQHTLHFLGSLARWQSASGDVEGVIRASEELVKGHTKLHGKDAELTRQARILLELAKDRVRKSGD
ncbi:NB-ARC domain-containing protein [Amycolatopsis sp. NPDC005003]